MLSTPSEEFQVVEDIMHDINLLLTERICKKKTLYVKPIRAENGGHVTS